MKKLNKQYLYIVTSVLSCLAISRVALVSLKEAQHAEYESMSIIAQSMIIFILTVAVTIVAFIFKADKLLKDKTIFIYIFSGTLNVTIAIVLFIFGCSVSQNKVPLFLSLISFLTGIYIYYDILKNKLKSG